MKRRIFALTLALATVFALSGCNKDEGTEPVDGPEDSSSSDTLGNPVVEQADGDYLEALGFTLELPEGITAEKYALIDGTIAEIQLKDADGNLADLRIGKDGTENLSGMFDVTFDTSVIGCGDNQTVTIQRKTAGGMLAEWTNADEGYMYSLYSDTAPAEGTDAETLNTMLTALCNMDITKLDGEEDATILNPDTSTPLEGGNPGTGLTEDELAEQAQLEAGEPVDNDLGKPTPGVAD